MRRLFLPILLISLPTVSHAGFREDYKPRSVLVLPEREERAPQCMSASGVDDATTVRKNAAILQRKFEAIPLDVVESCRFDGELIHVQRYAEYGDDIVIVTTVGDGTKRLVYDPMKERSSLVLADMKTWTSPDCPPSLAQGLMEVQLERMFACYPEPGYHVTTRAEDAAHAEAVRKANEETARLLMSGPKKNPGL